MNDKQKELLLKNMNNDYAQRVANTIFTQAKIKANNLNKIIMKSKNNGRRDDS